MQDKIIIKGLPFHIGAIAKPNNPFPLPDTLPFTFRIDDRVGALIQEVSSEILSTLQKIYSIGEMFGTPLADTKYGKPYADDFLKFLHSYKRPPGYRFRISLPPLIICR